ncbi:MULTISPECIES: EF-hand domain-containing protein [Pseudoxanthomonas]|jgi:hypothetical protein|nr:MULTISPECIES: EF-hand domain-containing protein [Pseudoxanthomonas]
MKRLRFHTPWLAMLACGVLAAPAWAQSQPSSPQQSALPPAADVAAPASAPRQQRWDDLDGNHDGSISKAEASANPGLSQVFDQVDTNADGAVSLDEYKAFVAKHYGAGAGEASPGR